ncbi:hypothetical protein CEXT_800801 [Caerostris extrusa]|uniref:Uncharacterized protein n=1 Tax=Caerostris extrusa TaxID=172846 RepID=A0AAV4XMU5_CAEEX|nr:hypothetical protein CEXT_800801 [Caerostris extrusa]
MELSELHAFPDPSWSIYTTVCRRFQQRQRRQLIAQTNDLVQKVGTNRKPPTCPPGKRVPQRHLRKPKRLRWLNVEERRGDRTTNPTQQQNFLLNLKKAHPG